MVEGNIFNIPLSPPSSPRLSAYHHQDASQTSWQEQHKNPLEVTPDSSDDTMALVHSEMPTIDLNLDRKPLLRHKTFPYTLRTTGLGADLTDPALEDHSPTSVHTSNGLIEPVQASDMPTMNFGGSAPASPLSNLTPVSPHKDSLDDITSQDLGLDLDDDLMEEKPDKPMTAAEIRNQKRKMKRFRLTHNQTRFLMSEFARQAHPDAAHRERLAREIPGLSPRQVQVWFQNRRAKLKRLTSDDRERMMRSRALPDDFDMTQALHSPFGPGHNVGGSLSTPTSYAPTFPEGNMIRPLNLDSLRRVPDTAHSSPGGGFAPTFPSSFFTPPQSVTDTLSPVSPAGDSPFAYSPTLDGSPRRGNPFAGSPSNFTSHPAIPRLGHLHERRDQSLTSSPLLGGPESGGMMPYGLGLTYPNMSAFSQPPTSRMRSFSNNNNNMRPRIELSNTSFAPNRTAPTPQSATFPPFTSSPLQTSYSMLSTPHNVTSFPNTYMRQEPSPTSEPFPSNEFKLSDHDDDDSHNTVPPMPSF